MTVVDDTTDVRVRAAQRADLIAVHRIERAVFPQPWPFNAFERYLDAEGFLVAVDDDAEGSDVDDLALVGFVVADVMPNHSHPFGHVKDLAVDPDRQGAGIGSTLLERALSRLAGEGANSVKLEVRASNEPALELYDDFGFEPMRRRPQYYDDGEDAIVMVRELSAVDE